MTPLDGDRVALLGEALGCRLDPSSLLTMALTHRSYAAENEGSQHYERLEFLGDAVLELAVTRYIYERYPLAAEGEMAKVRAAVVAEPVLAALARRFGLPDLVRLGRGEHQTGGRDKDSILSDIVESVLAVVYLEAGYAEVEAVVHRHWGPLVDDRAAAPGRRDYKTRLQEAAARRGQVPVYVVSDEGPQHAKTFTASVAVSGSIVGSGSGTSKKRAEQEAARTALAVIESWGDA
jgi:ribonuclease-3